MQELIAEYQEVAQKIRARIEELKQRLKNTRGQDALLMEKRIEVLWKEYWDTCDTIKEMFLSQKR